MKLALLSGVILVCTSACNPAYISVPLPLPQKPDMPSYTDTDLACLPDAVYYRVAWRDLAHKHYEKRLEAVIKSTWDSNNGL